MVRDGARLVVQTWLISRLLMVGVALWVGMTTGRSPGDMLANWDVQHYFDIATHGYVADNSIAFFPGWPLVLRAFSMVGVPMLWAGVCLAVICSAFAAAALYRLGGPIAAVVWLLAPTTVFTMVPYTEAPFCAAAFGAWERARAGRWGAAATLAALACTLRVSGLFLLCALVILALSRRWLGSGRPAVSGASSAAQWGAPSGWSGGSTGGAGARTQATSGRALGYVRDLLARLRSPKGRGAAGSSGVATAGPSYSSPQFSSRPQGSSTPRSSGNWPQPGAVDVVRGWLGDGRVRALAWLSIPALTLFGYIAYLYNLTGDWNAWYRAQSTGWPRGFTWPWVSLQHTIEAATSNAYPAFPEWSWVFRAELGAMAVGVIVTLICLRKRRWAEAAWVGVQVLAFSCSYWYLSVTRAMLLWFPLFVLIGERLSGGWNLRPSRRRLRTLLTAAVFVLAAFVLCWWSWLFFTGRWAS